MTIKTWNPGDKTEIDALLRTAERSTSPDEPTFGVITIDAGDFDALVKLARAVPTPKASDQDRVLAEARAVLEAGCREREEIARRSANHREPLKVDRDAAFADEVELATLTVPLPALKAVLGAFEPTLPASSNLASKREAMEGALIEGERLIMLADRMCSKMGLRDRGHDVGLSHEARMFALAFSAEDETGQHGVFKTGDGSARKWRKGLRVLFALQHKGETDEQGSR